MRGAVSDFRIDDYECTVTFKGPGYDADALIDRETGRYELAQTYHGLLAVVMEGAEDRSTGDPQPQHDVRRRQSSPPVPMKSA